MLRRNESVIFERSRSTANEEGRDHGTKPETSVRTSKQEISKITIMMHRGAAGLEVPQHVRTFDAFYDKRCAEGWEALTSIVPPIDPRYAVAGDDLYGLDVNIASG